MHNPPGESRTPATNALDRRHFLSLVAGAVIARRISFAPARGVSLYASVGKQLTRYDVDVDAASLVARETITLPANVQYAYPHVSRNMLYVAASNGGPTSRGDVHYVFAYRIDGASGALTQHGAPVSLRSRPIYISTDKLSEYLLVAYNDPSAVTVHRLGRDGVIGDEIPQPGITDAGSYAHEVHVTPSNQHVILVTRGSDASAATGERPGALKIFRFDRGLLSDETSIAPAGGYGFGPRNFDFHPSTKWMYLSVERQNELWVFDVVDDVPTREPIYRRQLLANASDVRAQQVAGTLHLHPNGRFLYCANRANGTVSVDGHAVFNGGENTIVVYSLNQQTGEPTFLQRIDTRGIHARTFHIDPTGRLLVAANVMPLDAHEGSSHRTIPAGMSLFRIGGDGMLTFVRKYDIDVGADTLFWMGMIAAP